MHEDLLEQARHLATRDKKGKPKQANLRRAVSSAYYAMFHLLVAEATKHLLRNTMAKYRSRLARAFTHKAMKVASKWFTEGGTIKGLGPVTVPPDLKAVAQAVLDLQQARHEADYNLHEPLTRTEALEFVEKAEQAQKAWKRVRKDDVSDLYLLLLLTSENLKERD
ncbi:MAG TPA: hypothetical protein VFF73_20985 [Planctomycetota bacterium]|nr:hypothetical protein [Planctomycetota bacterium]